MTTPSTATTVATLCSCTTGKSSERDRTLTTATAFTSGTATEKTELLDRFRTSKICKIIPTNTNIKADDTFELYRPRPKTVLDYSISETDAKIQKTISTGVAKIHLKQTRADYVHPPPGYIFPEDEPPPEPELTPPPPPPTPPPSKKSKKVRSAVSSKTSKTTVTTVKSEKPDILERFHSPKICQILPTTTAQKPDIFELYRPKPRTVLDYTISQTYTKVEKKLPIGVARVHVQQTTADYVLPPPGYEFPPEAPPPPPPPPESKFEYSTGGPPVWDSIDDIWKRKVERRQKVHRANLERLKRENRKYDAAKKAAAHTNLTKLIGPDWYEELSPNQMRTVDNLKSCIMKDLKYKSIVNCQNNIGALGLHLRPNPRHLETALRHCCQCPIEFLLILYQLMNHRRTKYSLNDRLLLSAVVHLTIRDTLKELHIRIPSPPPPVKEPKAPPKPKEPKRYKSPYLVPFTFVPAAPKHTGIYQNQHVQYPESPYFSYIDELKSDANDEPVNESDNLFKKKSKSDFPKTRNTKRQRGITDEQEKALIGELRVAQREYNSLANYELPLLHKPRIYIECDHNPRSESESESETTGTKKEVSVSIEVKVTTAFDEVTRSVRKTCLCNLTFDDANGDDTEVEDESISMIFEPDPTESKNEDESNLKDISTDQTQTEELYKNVGISTDGPGDDTGEVRPTEVAPEQIEEKKLELEDETLITVGPRKSFECKCKEESEKIIETTLCQCDRCKADRADREERKKGTYIISGLRQVQGEDDDYEMVKVIEGVKARKTCNCLEQYYARVRMYVEMKKRFEAQQALTSLQQQYVIGGVTQGPDGQPVYMLSGTVPHHECPCVEALRAQAEEAHRLANMPSIPLGKQKYVISGVQETEQGNVYVVSGAVATEPCPCQKMYQNYENRHNLCMEVYQKYLQKIQIDTEEYMTELATDSRYGDTKPESTKSVGIDGADDGSQEPRKSINSEISEPKSKEPSLIKSLGSAEEPQLQNRSASDKISEPEQVPTCKCASLHKKEEEEVKPTCKCVAIDEVEEEEEEERSTCKCSLNNRASQQIKESSCNKPVQVEPVFKTKQKGGCLCHPDETSEGSGKVKPPCVCTNPPPPPVCVCEEVAPIICDCGYESSSSEEEPQSELYRFIILKTFPYIYSEQLELLKRALQILAKDNFPLARLPDCWKLPHFKLWLKFRCGKFWTQEARVNIFKQSFMHWKHLGYCSHKVKEKAQLDMAKEEGRKYTWRHAKEVRRIALEKETTYYRQLRQSVIKDAREFFPSTFSYEFPTSNFRDCFFAYTPTKEEECICWRPWFPHEIKNLKRC